MRDEQADLILNMLQAIHAEQAAQREKLDEIIIRLGRLEGEVAGVHADYAGLSARLHNLDHHVARIEQRLELVDTAMPG